ncbi:hypothetical protein C8R45DRAFT_325306 [Mycena sanguinolenta]|nr:hypothetical protein C8R45DRAFT_325306 [Mycena sanguinolenta]
MPLLPVPIPPVLLLVPPLLCRIHICPRLRVYPTKSDARAVDAAKSVAMDENREMEGKSGHLKWMMRRRSYRRRRKRRNTPSRIPTPAATVELENIVTRRRDI